MKIQLILFCTFFLTLCSICKCMENSNSTNTKANTSNEILSRKRRFIIFPEGASFSCAVCMTVGVYGNPNYQLFSWALNYGFVYDLPQNVSAFHGSGGGDMMDDIMDPAHMVNMITDPPTTTEPTTVASKDHVPGPDPPPMSMPPMRKRMFVPMEMPKSVMQRRYRRDLYNKLEIAMTKMGYDGRQCILRAMCESSQLFRKKGSNMVEELIRIIFSFPKSKVLSFEHQDLMVYDEAYRKGRNKIYCANLYPQCGFSLIDLALGKYSEPTKNFM